VVSGLGGIAVVSRLDARRVKASSSHETLRSRLGPRKAAVSSSGMLGPRDKRVVSMSAVAIRGPVT
jgi:hypothetical protein